MTTQITLTTPQTLLLSQDSQFRFQTLVQSNNKANVLNLSKILTKELQGKAIYNSDLVGLTINIL